MSDSTTRDRIELEVKDFGPIVEARIDLRPLTVFIGPSNTGKSWLATLIYALHRSFGSDLGPDHWRASRKSLMLRDREARKPLEDAVETIVKSVGLDLFVGKGPSEGATIELPRPILDEIRSVFDARGSLLADEVLRCLGIDDVGALPRRGSRNGVHAALRWWPSDLPTAAGHHLTLRKRGAEFKGCIPDVVSLTHDELEDLAGEFFRHMGKGILETMVSEKKREDFPFLARTVITILEKSLRGRAVGSLARPAFYFPADRTGVMHMHGALVSGIIGATQTRGSQPSTSAPLLSGVLADFLRQIIEVDRHRSEEGRPLPEIAAQIEEGILGGAVYVERSELNISPHFMYRPRGWKKPLPLAGASSMVSELAPLVLYLRHLVRPGNVLIIEEPESSLHPAMQVALIRQLAALVRAGVEVVLTTHSEWVLEELANIVRSSDLPESRRSGIAGAAVALLPEQVGAWLFRRKQRPKGSVVEELKLDEETGLYASDYGAVSDALYDDNVRIFNRTRDLEAE